MEAKVDVRKLQMLNDRIIQTLEALTQVRASVHGIGQTSPYSVQPQPGMPGIYGQAALGHSPVSPYAPYASPYAAGYLPPIGLSHSSYSSYAQSPFVPSHSPWQTFPQQSHPYAPHYAQSPYAQSPYAQTQWSPFAPMGLSHTGIDELERRMVEQRAGDIGRLMQTFPYGAYV